MNSLYRCFSFIQRLNQVQTLVKILSFLLFPTQVHLIDSAQWDLLCVWWAVTVVFLFQ